MKTIANYYFSNCKQTDKPTEKAHKMTIMIVYFHRFLSKMKITKKKIRGETESYFFCLFFVIWNFCTNDLPHMMCKLFTFVLNYFYLPAIHFCVFLLIFFFLFHFYFLWWWFYYWQGTCTRILTIISTSLNVAPMEEK